MGSSSSCSKKTVGDLQPTTYADELALRELKRTAGPKRDRELASRFGQLLKITVERLRKKYHDTIDEYSLGIDYIKIMTIGISGISYYPSDIFTSKREDNFGNVMRYMWYDRHGKRGDVSFLSDVDDFHFFASCLRGIVIEPRDGYYAGFRLIGYYGIKPDTVKGEMMFYLLVETPQGQDHLQEQSSEELSLEKDLSSRDS